MQIVLLFGLMTLFAALAIIQAAPMVGRILAAVARAVIRLVPPYGD